MPVHVHAVAQVQTGLDLGDGLVPATPPEPLPGQALIPPGEIIGADSPFGHPESILEGLIGLGVPVEFGQADAAVKVRGQLRARSRAQ